MIHSLWDGSAQEAQRGCSQTNHRSESSGDPLGRTLTLMSRLPRRSHGTPTELPRRALPEDRPALWPRLRGNPQGPFRLRCLIENVSVATRASWHAVKAVSGHSLERGRRAGNARWGQGASCGFVREGQPSQASAGEETEALSQPQPQIREAFMGKSIPFKCQGQVNTGFSDLPRGSLQYGNHLRRKKHRL